MKKLGVKLFLLFMSSDQETDIQDSYEHLEAWCTILLKNGRHFLLFEGNKVLQCPKFIL